MAKIEIEVPDALWRRMRMHQGEDWPEVALRALAARTDELAAQAKKSVGYAIGYQWARDRAEVRDLVAVVEAPSHALAAVAVREAEGFSQRDEFGDALHPSDEMWEAFVDGATALYDEMSERAS